MRLLEVSCFASSALFASSRHYGSRSRRTAHHWPSNIWRSTAIAAPSATDVYAQCARALEGHSAQRVRHNRQKQHGDRDQPVKSGKKGAGKENVPPHEEVERQAVVCVVLLRNDAAGDAALAATVLRLIRVVVPALMNHERSASDIREL